MEFVLEIFDLLGVSEEESAALLNFLKRDLTG